MLYRPVKKPWFITLFALSCFCFLAALKRIAVFAMVIVAVIRIIIWLFSKLSERAEKRCINIIMLIAAVLLVAYIWVIKAGVFTLMEKGGIDTSGRAYIYSHVNNYYSFSPLFVGNGIGFLTYQLNEVVSLRRFGGAQRLFAVLCGSRLFRIYTVASFHNPFKNRLFRPRRG